MEEIQHEFGTVYTLNKEVRAIATVVERRLAEVEERLTKRVEELEKRVASQPR